MTAIDGKPYDSAVKMLDSLFDDFVTSTLMGYPPHILQIHCSSPRAWANPPPPPAPAPKELDNIYLLTIVYTV